MSQIEIDSPIAQDPESAFGTRQPYVHAPRSLTRADDPPGSDVLGLSPSEIEQFRAEGYVVKRGLISPAQLKPFVDLWWQQPPITAAGVLKEDSGTWATPGKHWPEENRWGLAHNWMGGESWPGPLDPRQGADVGERVGRLPHKLTQDLSNDVWRWHGIGHDPDFVDATSAHPNVLYMAEAIMGGPVKRPRRNRGIYAIFPRDPDGPAAKLGPHMDANMTEMQVVTLLNDVPPGGGGFTFYPGSPQMLYPTSEQAYNWVATEASDDAMNRIKANVTPIEFTGKAGDVLFCHGWVVHSAGAHEGDRIRMAVIQDFNRSRPRGHMRWSAAGKFGGPRIHCNMDGIFQFSDYADDDPEDGLREVTNQWIMDSNEFVTDRREPFAGAFEDWNLGQRPVQGLVVDEPTWWDRYGLPLVPVGEVPRGGGGMPAVPLQDVARYVGEGCWQVELRPNL